MKAEVVELLMALGQHHRQRGDAGRARAYLRAAHEVARRPESDLQELVARKALRTLPGIGASIERTIHAFLERGERPAGLGRAGEGLHAKAADEPFVIPKTWAEGPFSDTPDLHCHTTWSDGNLTLDELVPLAKRLGAKALGISDHSGSLRIARGLNPEAVRAQWQDIARVQAAHPDILLLKGTECDILADGTLDHPPDILEGFDYVIGSLHSELRAPMEKQTARLLAALDQPHLTIVGHPTTRVPGRRPRANLDLPRVFAAAAERGVALEVNGNRGRLDLDAALATQALAHGARLSLGSDAHYASELLQFAEARRMAKEAGAKKKDIVNYDVLKRKSKRAAAR